jgi:peptide/nickel transport system substrate-binding protein
MRRAWISIALLAVAAGLLGAGTSGGRNPPAVRDGGTFRITALPDDFDSLDPAIGYTPVSGGLLEATCAKLLNNPDRRPPQGFRSVPEVATGYPRVSHGGKMFTFVIRKGFRFSKGAPVRASAFARAINRVLSPALNSPGVQYVRDLVGAKDVLAGKATSAKGVVARGNRLILRFTRAVPDFPVRTTMSFFCAVPPNLPADPEGTGAYPGAGPYYVAQYVRGRRIVLQRNRFYREKRPHHVTSFVVDFAESTYDGVLDRVERGQADWAWASPSSYHDPGRQLARKYGVNKSQFWVQSGLGLHAFALNTSRPLFRNNPRLRRAINFAVDRPALRRVLGGPLVGTLTDQYLPPGFPGFRDGRVYPLTGPNLQKARALARGRLRGGKAVLYVPDTGPQISLAQSLKQSVEKIGLTIDIRPIPFSAYFDRLGTRSEAFDIAWFPWLPDYVDPYAYINALLDGRLITGRGILNFAHFNSRPYNGVMARAARLRGGARYRAYGKLDVQLSRDAAPWVAYMFSKAPTLVSKRVGCLVLRPYIDLAAACLK